MDLIPGRQNDAVVPGRPARRLSRPMRRVLRLQHAHMGLLVVAEPPERFRALARAPDRAPRADPTTAEQQRGSEVFLANAVRHVPHDPRHPAGGARRART